MKFIVKHEINGRLRIHVVQKRMTYTEADTLSWFLSNQKNVTDVKVYDVKFTTTDLSVMLEIRKRS